MNTLRIFTPYNKRDLWLLFSATAFMIHVWTFILFFRDFSWLAERSTAWDAIGTGAYALMYAVIESFVIFLAIIVMGIFISDKWEGETRSAILFVLMAAAVVWAMLGQLYFIWGIQLPFSSVEFLAARTHPLWWLYGAIGSVVITSVSVPIYFTLTSSKVSQFIGQVMERLIPLTVLYLFVDLVGLVVVLYRNIQG